MYICVFLLLICYIKCSLTHIYIYEVHLRAYIRKSKKYALKSYDTHDIHTLATNSQYEKIYQQIEIPIHYLK